MATSTASFGVGKRESHDSSAYYARRMTRSRLIALMSSTNGIG